MQTVRALLVDAFTDEPLAGNAAGVVPDAGDLTADQMQAIARELAVSETAFILPGSGGADHRLRYFTPETEIDLCGHATIATGAHLHEDGRLPVGSHAIETGVGVVDLDVDEDGTVWMTQDSPAVREVEVDYDRVADALGVDVAALRDIGADLPAAVASTGVPFLVVPANFLEHLSGADPDQAAVEALCRDHDATGLYLFTLDTVAGDANVHARAFVPLAGIPEDPVTGTAAGAIGAYLRQVGAFEGDMPEELVVEQGHFLDRPGRVRVQASGTIRVGGRAVTALDGSLAVPDADEDDIIEA